MTMRPVSGPVPVPLAMVNYELIVSMAGGLDADGMVLNLSREACHPQ